MQEEVGEFEHVRLKSSKRADERRAVAADGIVAAADWALMPMTTGFAFETVAAADDNAAAAAAAAAAADIAAAVADTVAVDALNVAAGCAGADQPSW
jgi:hypothetical protein